MNFRFIFAIQQAWHFKSQLKQYLVNPALQLVSVRDIKLDVLNAAGIKALILDYDGVLAAHGEPTPRPEIITWLQDLIRAYTPNKIYILSNKPTTSRQVYFKQNFPQIEFVIGKRKKPYPDGLQQIIAETGFLPAQLLLVDDRLLTGILATIIAGTKGYWVTKPYVNVRSRPFAEIGIIILRLIERVALGFVK
jgi:HAD superfamily phosphatase (TIGR01668 family)